MSSLTVAARRSAAARFALCPVAVLGRQTPEAAVLAEGMPPLARCACACACWVFVLACNILRLNSCFRL